ncbi:MAG: glycosyltransferase [Verrucomicrobia bacterium]|nr:glycosyltransferase [Verrucomicrobiota bacterium]
MIILILALLSVVLHAWQVWAGRTFRFRSRLELAPVLPSVSILKPVGTCDEITLQCLETWLHQRYPGDWEVLFGIDAGDVEVRDRLETLIAAHPDVAARVIPCAASADGNPKVAKLMVLEDHARWDCIVVSDADVQVAKTYLTSFVNEFTRSGRALACCLYRIESAGNLAQKLESDATNIDFWSQVAQARSLWPIDFALGASMVLHRATLKSVGGFQAFADRIADDFELGNRIHKQGKQILIASIPVVCRHSETAAGVVLSRQIRWARTMRHCKPLPYFLSILSNPTLWPLLAYLANRSDPACSGLFIGWILLRILLARGLQKRFLESSHASGTVWLTPLRDLLQAIVWASAFAGNRVVWSGRTYRLSATGSMTPVTHSDPPEPHH